MINERRYRNYKKLMTNEKRLRDLSIKKRERVIQSLMKEKSALINQLENLKEVA